jgi:ribokinase
MKSKPDVVVVGSLNMDLIFRTPRVPEAGETLLGGSFDTAFGGKGANQAVAAARLGPRVAMVGRVGDDSFGPSLRRGLEDDGIDTAHVRVDDEASTGTALILLEESGENRIVVASGANFAVAPGDVEAAAELIRGAQILLLQLEVPLPAVRRAVEIAHEAGVRVILNPAPAQVLPEALLQGVDILAPNQVEATMLAELPDDTPPEEAARALRETGAGVVVVTLGGEGALLLSDEGAQRVPAFPTEVVDTTAAGDAFMGGLAAALIEGLPLEEAVRWGNAAGSLASSKLGAQPSLPTREALEKRLEQ